MFVHGKLCMKHSTCTGNMSITFPHIFDYISHLWGFSRLHGIIKYTYVSVLALKPKNTFFAYILSLSVECIIYAYVEKGPRIYYVGIVVHRCRRLYVIQIVLDSYDLMYMRGKRGLWFYRSAK